MDGSIILGVLAVFGVIAIAIFCLKGFVQQLQDFLDSLPGLFAAWHRARHAMRGQAQESEGTTATVEPRPTDTLPSGEHESQ